MARQKRLADLLNLAKHPEHGRIDSQRLSDLMDLPGRGPGRGPGQSAEQAAAQDPQLAVPLPPPFLALAPPAEPTQPTPPAEAGKPTPRPNPYKPPVKLPLERPKSYTAPVGNRGPAIPVVVHEKKKPQAGDRAPTATDSKGELQAIDVIYAASKKLEEGNGKINTNELAEKLEGKIDFNELASVINKVEGKGKIDINELAEELNKKLAKYQAIKQEYYKRFQDIDQLYPGKQQQSAKKPALTAMGKLERNPQLQFGLLVGAIVLVLLFAESFRKLQQTAGKLSQHQHQLAAWLLFLPLVSVTFLLEPEHEDPSHLITFAAGTQLFSFALLWLLPRKPLRAAAAAGSHPGDSPEFALLMAMALSVRAACTTHFQGYLPTDASGDGGYQVLEALGALLALRGLVRLGLRPPQALAALSAAAGAAVLAYECHGDLDGNALADTAWAASVYMETLAWYFICRNLLRAGASRRVDTGFLAPACAQAVLRTIFWFLASDEVEPKHPERAMAAFPHVIVGLHILLSAGLVTTTLLVYLHVPVPTSVAEAAVEMQKLSAGRAEPLLGSVRETVACALAAAAGDFGEEQSKGELVRGPLARSNMVPVRAVYEAGKMHIEYSM